MIESHQPGRTTERILPGTTLAPSPLRNSDPPTTNAELTVYALGDNQDDIIPALQLLGDFSHRQLRVFQQSLPCTMTLPAVYYDKSNPFVALLRSSGTRFKIVAYAWVCPDEIKDDHHWCTSTCSIVRMEQITT